MINMAGNRRGFTLIELMIVVVVLGILAGIGIPRFLDMKDKTIWRTARTNMGTIRHALASYAADKPDNLYPVGTLNFAGMKTVLPRANLPAAEEDAKFQDGSFLYTSAEGLVFSFTANCTNRANDLLAASPDGITPASYEDYEREH